MEKSELIESLRTARMRGERPTVEWGTDLRDADLRYENLRDANLRGADLRNADLRHTNLLGANLRNADLRNADLRNAILQGADLRSADLRGANPWGADLRSANLRCGDGGILQVTGLHPYQAVMFPSDKGWWLQIGCWEGTTQELRDLIAQDDWWPEAEGEQITARRPLLNMLADMCDLHAANHQDALDTVMKRWGNEKEN